MKHWRNNWEKRLGIRLRKAEVQPESYLWSLIEGELDARAAQRRAAAWRVAGGALLFALLLTTTVFYLNEPSARLAKVAGSQGFPVSTEGFAFLAPDGAVAQPAVSAAVAGPVRSPQPVTPEALQIARQEPGITRRNSPEQDLNAGAFMPEAVHLEGMGAVAAQSELPRDVFRQPVARFRSGKRELMRRIAGAYDFKAPLLVQRTERDVLADMPIHHLAGRPAVLNAGAFREQVLAAVPESTGRDGSAVDALAFPGEQLEEKEETLAWNAGLEEELTAWKESLESEEEEAAAPEPLVEKALLDEAEEHGRELSKALDVRRTSAANRGFHMGVVGGFQTTWLRPASRNPEIDRSAVEYRMAPGFQAGINLGYDITDHFGLMVEFKYSDEGGKYYNPVKDRREHLDLKYLELPVYAKVKHSLLTDKSRLLVFNYLVGVRYSDLRVVSATLEDGTDQRFGQDYSTSKWGFSAGFELDYYLTPNLFMSVGMRGGVTGNARSFPKLAEDGEHGAIGYDAGVFTRLSYRFNRR